jgi:hypothetical protein
MTSSSLKPPSSSSSVLAMIGKRQRGRRSKRPDYKLESVATRAMRVHAGAGLIAEKFMNVHRH